MSVEIVGVSFLKEVERVFVLSVGGSQTGVKLESARSGVCVCVCRGIQREMEAM